MVASLPIEFSAVPTNLIKRPSLKILPVMSVTVRSISSSVTNPSSITILVVLPI